MSCVVGCFNIDKSEGVTIAFLVKLFRSHLIDLGFVLEPNRILRTVTQGSRSRDPYHAPYVLVLLPGSGGLPENREDIVAFVHRQELVVQQKGNIDTGSDARLATFRQPAFMEVSQGGQPGSYRIAAFHAPYSQADGSANQAMTRLLQPNGPLTRENIEVLLADANLMNVGSSKREQRASVSSYALLGMGTSGGGQNLDRIYVSTNEPNLQSCTWNAIPVPGFNHPLMIIELPDL